MTWLHSIFSPISMKFLFPSHFLSHIDRMLVPLTFFVPPGQSRNYLCRLSQQFFNWYRNPFINVTYYSWIQRASVSWVYNKYGVQLEKDKGWKWDLRGDKKPFLLPLQLCKYHSRKIQRAVFKATALCTDWRPMRLGNHFWRK